jgi:hypothetical protein
MKGRLLYWVSHAIWTDVSQKPLGKRLSGRPRETWENSEIDFRATCGENEYGCLQIVTSSLFVKKTAPAG